MKIIYNRYIPLKGFDAVNLCGILLVHPDFEPDEDLLNHERIHTIQMKELIFIGFYLIYLSEFILRLTQCLFAKSKSGKISKWQRAYRSISFEREAYSHWKELTYLEKRKPYAMWR